jgi:hypothetical protein
VQAVIKGQVGAAEITRLFKGPVGDDAHAGNP